MMIFEARIRCPSCRHAFTVRVEASDKTDADAKVDPKRRIEVLCPMDMGRLRVPAFILRRTDGQAELCTESESPKRRWWQFWG